MGNGDHDERYVINGNGWAGLLRLIAKLMGQLADEGTTGSIDLLAQPLDEEDFARLREFLGEGEIAFDLANDGTIEVRETAYAGVWWVTHRDSDGNTIADFIEIAYCPDVMIADPLSVADGRDAMLAQLLPDSFGANS